jgi:hypothetical protein
MSLKDYLNYLKLSAKTIIKLIILIFLLHLSAESTSAQVQPLDSNNVKIDTSKFVMKKSAWGAVIRSAVIPGFGQFYNESYWKIPVVWGFLGWFAYQWNTSNNSYINYRDLYNGSINQNSTGNSSYLSLREFYKDQRDLFAVFFGLAYLLNLIDAYVDAHLFDFDVSKISTGELYRVSLKIKL